MAFFRVSNGGTAEMQYITGTGTYRAIICKDSYAIATSRGSINVTLNGVSLTQVAEIGVSGSYSAGIYHVGSLNGTETLYIQGQSGCLFYVE